MGDFLILGTLYLTMWKDYFSFNKRQRNGIIVLLTLIVGMMIYLLIADYLPPSQANIDFSSFKADVAKTRPTDTSSKTSSVIKQDNISHLASIELNTADSADFTTLPQVTPKLARTIVHFRDALGGYSSKTRLMEVYGMDSSCYKTIVTMVTIDTTKVEKLDINKATEKELSHHPYIHKKLAKAIYEYRKTNGPFLKIKDIVKVDGIDEEKCTKLAPYLTIDK